MGLPALKLPPLEDLAPPGDYGALSKIVDRKYEPERRQIHTRLVGLMKDRISAINKLAADFRSFRGSFPASEEQLEHAIGELEKNETQARETLGRYQAIRDAFARAKSRESHEAALKILRDAVDDTQEEIELARAICVAFRDLRWEVVAIHARGVERRDAPSFSTYQEYLAATGRR